MFSPSPFRVGAVVCVTTAAALGAAPSAAAVPSEAEIVERLTRPNTKEVRVWPQAGKRHTSASRDGRSVSVDDYWARGVTIVQDAGLEGFPDAAVEIDGTVRYDILPDGFSYREFKSTESRYVGLPNPTEEEVVAVLQDNLREVIGGTLYDQGVVGGGVVFTLADEPEWAWPKANTVEVDVIAAYVRREEGHDPRAVEQVEHPHRVTLFRDSPDAAFDKTTRASSRGQPTVTTRRELSREQMAKLRGIGEQARIDAAEAEAAAMPAVEVPAFTRDVELFAYTHRMLREAPDAELEAYLRRVASDAYLQDGGPALNPSGRAWVDEIMAEARGKEVTYGQAYGPDPEVKHYQGGMVQWYTALKPIHPAFSRMTAVAGGGEMRNGQMQNQELRLGVVALHVSDEPAHVQWLASFDSPEALDALHAGQRSLSDLVEEFAPAAAAAPPAPAEWASFSSEPVGFTVELPGEPELTQELANGKYPRHLTTVEAGGAMVQIAVNLYPVELTESQATALVDGTGSGYAEMIQAQLRGAQSWDLGGVYGRRFQIQHPSAAVAYACAVKGNAFYTVAVAGDDPATIAATADRVLNTLEAP